MDCLHKATSATAWGELSPLFRDVVNLSDTTRIPPPPFQTIPSLVFSAARARRKMAIADPPAPLPSPMFPATNLFLAPLSSLLHRLAPTSPSSSHRLPPRPTAPLNPHLVASLGGSTIVCAPSRTGTTAPRPAPTSNQETPAVLLAAAPQDRSTLMRLGTRVLAMRLTVMAGQGAITRSRSWVCGRQTYQAAIPAMAAAATK